jgi:quinoprotein glucose dehydrogenase
MITGRAGRLKGLLLIGCVIACLGLPAISTAQWKAKDTEWASYAADLAGTRYRPLEQINAANFNELEIAWRIKTDNFGNRPEYKLEGTPLMVGGVLYATAGSRRAAIALDAVTGELLWIHGEHERRTDFVCDARLSAYFVGCEDWRARGGVWKQGCDRFEA